MNCDVESFTLKTMYKTSTGLCNLQLITLEDNTDNATVRCRVNKQIWIKTTSDNNAVRVSRFWVTRTNAVVNELIRLNANEVSIILVKCSTPTTMSSIIEELRLLIYVNELLLFQTDWEQWTLYILIVIYYNSNLHTHIIFCKQHLNITFL